MHSTPQNFPPSFGQGRLSPAAARARPSNKPRSDRKSAGGFFGQIIQLSANSPSLPERIVDRLVLSDAPDLNASYRFCREIARHHSKTFYFASVFLPPVKRRAIWAIYAYCRTADDIADASSPAAVRLAALDDWREQLIAAYRGYARHAVMMALADSAARFDIPIEPALDLLLGACRDVTVLRYETYDDLLEYCYLVASTVGLLTSPVLGYEPGALPYGVALGQAMQMTNILRDVGEDARMGRIYLPAEDLRRFGYSEENLLSATLDRNFVNLMKFEIERVRAMYEAAEPGIDLLASASRSTVRIALSLYRCILDEIERNDYDVFTRRASVPMRTKLVTAMMIALRRPVTNA